MHRVRYTTQENLIFHAQKKHISRKAKIILLLCVKYMCGKKFCLGFPAKIFNSFAN